MTNTTLNEYQSHDGAMSQGTIKGNSKSRAQAQQRNIQQVRQEYAENLVQADKINVPMKLDMDDSNMNMHQ